VAYCLFPLGLGLGIEGYAAKSGDNSEEGKTT